MTVHPPLLPFRPSLHVGDPLSISTYLDTFTVWTFACGNNRVVCLDPATSADTMQVHRHRVKVCSGPPVE